MIRYLSTGNFWKPSQKPQKFINRQASRGEGGVMSKRNYEDTAEYDFKSSSNLKSLKPTHDNYHKINNTYKESPYFYGSQVQSSQPLNHDDKVVKDQYFTSARNQHLEEASHLNNWKVVKERKYAQRVQQEGTMAASVKGQYLDKQTYKERQINNQSQPTNDAKQMLARENLFQISKPLIRLDNDMKTQPLIRNVQTVSEDIPKWCTNTNKFYTPENFDQSKKQRQKKLDSTDIFGNTLLNRPKDPNNELWQDIPAMGQIYEKTRMGIFYEDPIKIRKTVTLNEIKKDHVHLKWAENEQKQRYETKHIPKIGTTDKLFIRQLEEKRDPNFPKVEKIGQTDIYKKIDKDKAIQLKIGHGTASTLNPVKY